MVVDGTTLSPDVTGEFSSTTRYFTYNMKVFTPSLIGTNETYKAYVAEADPDASGKYKIVTAAANGTISGTDEKGAFINFTSGSTATTFKLKAGQFLVFINTPVVTSYWITEEGAAGYIPNVRVTYNSVQDGNEQGCKNTSLVIPRSTNTYYKTTLYVGEAKNSADFINENDTTAPTGIDLNDMPFYGLIALALAAATAFIVINARKRRF